MTLPKTDTPINYKSPIQNWDYFANDWKDHGVKHAIKCIKAGIKSPPLYRTNLIIINWKRDGKNHASD